MENALAYYSKDLIVSVKIVMAQAPVEKRWKNGQLKFPSTVWKMDLVEGLLPGMEVARAEIQFSRQTIFLFWIIS